MKKAKFKEQMWVRFAARSRMLGVFPRGDTVYSRWVKRKVFCYQWRAHTSDLYVHRRAANTLKFGLKQRVQGELALKIFAMAQMGASEKLIAQLIRPLIEAKGPSKHRADWLYLLECVNRMP